MSDIPAWSGIAIWDNTRSLRNWPDRKQVNAGPGGKKRKNLQVLRKAMQAVLVRMRHTASLIPLESA